MLRLKWLSLGIAAFALFLFAPASKAQVSIGIGLGAAPVCAYGYYGYAPYHCAPYGYYGPEWFSGGTFIGAGPYYRGRDPHFHGYVDEHFDERHGHYGGPYPRGDEHYRPYGNGDFHGNAQHDVHGNDFHGGDHRH